ncbi:MAG: PDZ domain-containing protein, partial [Planctomycetota bacterium]
MLRSRPFPVLLASLVAAALACPAASARGDDALAALARRVGRAVVALDRKPRGAFRSGTLMDGQAPASGFLVADGHVVTLAALARGRRTLGLRLAGGVRASARVVGLDPLANIALLRLEEPDQVAARMGGELPALPFAPAGALRVGQNVFSVGNAFDSLRLDGQPAFSQGVVTTVARARQGVYRGPVIETDAAVNPGAFGGPLVDGRGRVVGVLVPSFSPRRWLGEAIPAGVVSAAVNALKAGEPPAHGRLGVRLRSSGGEAQPDGVEVAEVAADGPAARAGLRAGARIVAIDGARVYDTADVARELAPLPPGAPVRLDLGGRRVVCVLDRGRPVDLASAFRPRPEEGTGDAAPSPRKPPRLGLRLRERPERRFGLEVVEVDPQGLGARLGIRTGDVLMLAQRTRLRTLDDLRSALGNLAGANTLTLVLLRERRLHTLRLPLDRPLAEGPR